MAPGPAERVGQLPGMLQVVARPAEGMTGTNRALVCVSLECAVGAFQGPVVLRPAGGREELSHRFLEHRCPRDLGNERRTVVALEHQRRTVLSKERSQDRQHLFRRLTGYALPG